MSLKLLPVDEVWVDRMITLADVPWERATVEAMFVEWSLARPDEDVGWEGGPGAPQFAVDHEGEPSGWLVELGAAPPDPDVWVHLPCALHWPAFGAEEPDDPTTRTSTTRTCPRGGLGGRTHGGPSSMPNGIASPR
ncbi:hypothetical protein KBX37_06110 [Micromonospora sp. U56]|uniref:hypothetical protein n=1 Tax=Micromonospora sp. U56 TaxID=2824900 RepID=UPI001B3871C4|nr:hypothetical protein [Micromonospora sp. U56]MBQ0892681.1 hypothetical protein [Micromonospora sp. U56]